ncbi:MAG: 30S ribosomal protein S5 [Patescibacteria group bacterium]
MDKRESKFKKEKSEFDQAVIDIARVTRVMAGGKRMRFRACVVVGDRKGRVGMGLAKGADVSAAVQKAQRQAEKHAISVNLVGETIAHEVRLKDGSARIVLKPAPAGTGIISGGAVRTVLELVGIKNVVSKVLGTNNKINNVRAALKALASLKIKKEKIKKEEVKPE